MFTHYIHLPMMLIKSKESRFILVVEWFLSFSFLCFSPRRCQSLSLSRAKDYLIRPRSTQRDAFTVLFLIATYTLIESPAFELYCFWHKCLRIFKREISVRVIVSHGEGNKPGQLNTNQLPLPIHKYLFDLLLYVLIFQYFFRLKWNESLNIYSDEKTYYYIERSFSASGFSIGEKVFCLVSRIHVRDVTNKINFSWFVLIQQIDERGCRWPSLLWNKTLV